VSPMPDFVRRAIEAQGAVDPEAVEREVAELAGEPLEPEELTPTQAALFAQPPPRRHWQERDE